MTFGGDRVEALFSEALELPAPERAAWLDRRCRGAPQLRAQVERLLRADERVELDYLERAGNGAHVPPGTRVGRYEVGELLGEGGMGIVYAAHQRSPRREVALKVIRPDKLSPTTVRRFQREAELLGSLQHSGIAHVLESGVEQVETEDGRRLSLHYMVMELVRGVPLLEFAEREGLDRRARIELVASICDAVSHAHERGIVHRDLKPSNVLVVHSNEPRGFAPKLLDFGIALASEGEDLTRATLDGQIVGSLACMSPEQVSGDPSRVDARTDVYALGVLLYRLLSGSDPIEVDGCSVVEAVRRIGEGRARRLSSHDPGLGGDLSVIAAKALEREPERRYATAEALADDLRLHLRGLPIVARTDSALYVLGKTVRRHRSASLALLLAFVVLAAFAAHSARQSARLEREFRASRIERARLVGSLGNFQLAEEMLWREHLVDPRSLHSFWALWELYARDPCLGGWPVVERMIDAIAFHPDGHWFATSIEGSGLGIWDAEGRGQVAVLPTEAEVEVLDFPADGETLVAGALDGVVTVYRVGAGAGVLDLERRFVAHETQVSALDVDSRGETIATGSTDGVIRTWGLDGTRRTECAGAPGRIQIVCWSPDGSLVASGSNNHVRVHAAGDGHVVWEAVANKVVRALAFSPDGERLATSGDGRSILLWGASTGEALTELTTQNGAIRFLEFDPRRPDTLWASGWWKLLAWDLETGTAQSLFDLGVDRAARDRGHRRLATGGPFQVRLWDLEPQHARRLPAQGSATFSVVGQRTRRVVLVDDWRRVSVHDLDSGALVSEHDFAGSRVYAAEFSADESSLLVAGSGGVLRADLASWETDVLRPEEHSARTQGSLACSPDGRRFATTVSGGRVRLFDPSGEEVLELEIDAPQVLATAFDPRGERLAVTRRDSLRGLYGIGVWSLDGERVWEAETSALRRGGATYRFGPWTPAYSADGAYLAAGGWDDLVVVWESDSGKQHALLRDHRAVVWDVAFHPRDSNLLVSASDDGTAKLWDVRNERCLATFVSPEDRGEVTMSVGFGPEGGHLVVGGFGGTTVWDLGYFERHIAGNLPLQLARLGPELGQQVDRLALEAWSRGVLEAGGR